MLAPGFSMGSLEALGAPGQRLLDPVKPVEMNALSLAPWESSWGLPSPFGLMVSFSKSLDILINNRGASTKVWVGGDRPHWLPGVATIGVSWPGSELEAHQRLLREKVEPHASGSNNREAPQRGPVTLWFPPWLGTSGRQPSLFISAPPSLPGQLVDKH